MTFKAAHFYIADRLKTIYEPAEASNIARWVIEHLSEMTDSERIVKSDKLMNENQHDQLEHYVMRLMNHEPVQYVLNEAWFYGLQLYVDNNVLVPRPETEELVEWIISDYESCPRQLSILDIGTGSGCIALALKKKLGGAAVWSCDISEGALNVARKNAARLGIDVRFNQLDFLDEKQRNTLPVFDIIVSNPPYVPEKDKLTMHSNVLQFEPATALFVPDNDALVFYSAIAGFGKTHLADNGAIYTEIHESLGKAAADVFASVGHKTVLRKDMQGRDRMIKAF